MGLLAILLSLRSSIRRRYLVYLKPGYVKKRLETRKGSCGGCGGICCIRTRKCPFVDEKGLCKLYNSGKIPKFCKIFPIDEKDIGLAGVDDVCQYYWDKKK